MGKIKFIIFLWLLLATTQSYAAASVNNLEEKNIALVKNMFTVFAEGLDINALDTYYTKDFILESNGEQYNYQQYKDLEASIYQTLNSLKVTSYDDIFASGNKVVARMNIKLVKKSGESHVFQVILIAAIKDGKINHIWELTYPTWSDKVDVKRD